MRKAPFQLLFHLHMVMYCAWTSYMYLTCHAPEMDNAENNQRFNVLI